MSSKIKLGFGVGKGFCEGEFAHLDEHTARRLITLMARISESSFRRGLQHGWWARDTDQKFKIHPDKLRFGNESLGSARMALCGTRMTSIVRLRIQHGNALQAIGFDLPLPQ